MQKETKLNFKKKGHNKSDIMIEEEILAANQKYKRVGLIIDWKFYVEC